MDADRVRVGSPEAAEHGHPMLRSIESTGLSCFNAERTVLSERRTPPPDLLLVTPQKVTAPRPEPNPRIHMRESTNRRGRADCHAEGHVSTRVGEKRDFPVRSLMRARA